MKAIVENTPVITKELKDNSKSVYSAFIHILTIITLENTEKCLKDSMDHQYSIFKKYFKYGFGSRHMWVKQVNNTGSELLSERLIIVEF